MDTIVLDLETTANGGPSGTSPEAHWDVNRVLMAGWWMDAHEIQTGTIQDLIDVIGSKIEPHLIAHNAKFDLKYLMKWDAAHGRTVDWDKVKVTCTMTESYLRSGHLNKFITLADLADIYGVPTRKTLDLGNLLAQGVKMEDIPEDELREYLKTDVEILGKIWNQMKTAHEMDYILPLCEMELNGLRVDQNKYDALLLQCTTEMNICENAVRRHIQQCCEWQDGSAVEDEDFTDQIGTKTKYIKTHANRTLSFLLTGQPAVLNVTAKWKLQYKQGYMPYHCGRKPACYKNPTHLGYPMDETVLKYDNNWITRSALKHRKAEKIVGTYLVPFAQQMKAGNGTVHPKLNTTATGTGRLSSSKPNGQNIPPIVRKLIVPHYTLGKQSVYEVDFSQLEMVTVACVSGCKDMQRALNNGDDLHYLTGKQVFGWRTPADMTDKDRKLVKNVNFGILYGGKAAGLAYQTGVHKDQIQKLINAFYNQFPGVKKWQRRVFENVVDNMEPFGIVDGEQKYMSQYECPVFKRKYTFVEQKAPAWLTKKTGRKFSFSYPQTCNYPIQGAAGGDIVMSALYYLWKHLPADFLITVHDSIVFSYDTGELADVKLMVDAMCRHLESKYNLPVSLHCDVVAGTNWS